MRKWILTLLIFCSVLVTAQKTIRGKVLTMDEIPLVGASVYLNNSSIGTTTNDNGEFELTIKHGKYDLIASYIGFNTVQFPLDTKEINQLIVFKLSAKTNMLDEVIVSNRKNNMSPEDRAYFLSRFKTTFIGQTNLSKECRIINDEVIDFDFNPLSKVLEASVSKPIIIEHKGLGYRIHYDLIHFELEPQKVTYLGYTRYEQRKGSKRKKRKWKKKRQVAYNGSTMHFLKSVLSGNFKEEGFTVDQFKRIPNPERPSEEEIRKARKILRLKSGDNFVIDINGNNSNKELDEARYIMKKARLKKFIDVELRKDLSLDDFTTKTGDKTFLSFQNYLKITYSKESEEDNYRPGPHKLDHQISTMVLYVSSSLIDASGILINPLDAFFEGYWSYEKTGDALPLDYTPED